MDHQNVVLMKKEETIQRELEKHFDELRDRYNDEMEMMKRVIEEIEDRDINSGYKDDDFLKNIVEKMKTSLHRFDKSTRYIDCIAPTFQFLIMFDCWFELMKIDLTFS